MKRTRLDAVDDGLFVFENTYVDDVTWDGHEAFAGLPAELGEARRRLAIQADPRGILPGRDD